MPTEEKVLHSQLAGTWYAGDARQLAAEIDRYLATVDPAKRVEDVVALLLPHAGYRYSGQVAARAVGQLAGRTYERVVVIGPCHCAALQTPVSLPEATHIETPLGRIELDGEAMARLAKCPLFRTHPFAHREEHSVQIELPLLQRVLGDFRLVPVITGWIDEANARAVAAAMREVVDDRTLVVASSDFTHYGSNFGYAPFRSDIRKNLEHLDMGAFKHIAQRNLHGFLRYIRETGATICGSGPIAILLALLPDDATVQLVEYDTSGSLTGDWSHCVSYVSAAVSGHWAFAEEREASGSATEGILSAADKSALLRLARHQIAWRLDIAEPDMEVEPTPAMQSVMGAFVTLHKHGHLRGCIGEILPRRPLHEAVAEQAVNAAFHDPRFPRLRPEELAQIDIEISALTTPRPVDSWEEIEVGRHGVVLEKHGRSAVFLPQVATEQGWGIEETLGHLAVKAGLGSDDWRHGCSFQVFEAIVFGERV